MNLESFRNKIGSLEREQTIKFVFVVAALVSLLALAWNRGFYFTEYNLAYELQLSGEHIDEAKAELSANSHTAAMRDQVVELQHITEDEVQETIRQLTQTYSGLSVSYTETLSLMPANMLERAVLGVVVVVIVWLGAVYYAGVRGLKTPGKLKTFASLAFLLGGSLVIAFVVLLGVLSTLSRIFELKFTTFGAVYVILLWATFATIWMAAALKAIILQPNLESRAAIAEEIENLSALAFGKTWQVWLVVVGAMIVALGKGFVIDGLVMLVGAQLVIVALMFLPTSLVNVFSVKLKPVFSLKRKSSVEQRAVAKPKRAASGQQAKRKKKIRR